MVGSRVAREQSQYFHGLHSENPDYRLDVADLVEWESKHGKIPDGAVVVMYSGHGRHYSNLTRYFGYPPGVREKNPRDTENMHFPGFHHQAANWLAENRSLWLATLTAVVR